MPRDCKLASAAVWASFSIIIISAFVLLAAYLGRFTPHHAIWKRYSFFAAIKRSSSSGFVLGCKPRMTGHRKGRIILRFAPVMPDYTSQKFSRNGVQKRPKQWGNSLNPMLAVRTIVAQLVRFLWYRFSANNVHG